MTSQKTGIEGTRIVTSAALGLTAGCAMLLYLHGTDEQGLRVCIRATARVSALFLLVVFPASALHRRFRSDATGWVMRNRRYLGLSLASSHTLHLAFILALYQLGAGDTVEPTTLYGGGWGYVMLFLMAVTSNDASVRALGDGWRMLHTVGIYTLWIIFAVSYLPADGSPVAIFFFTALLAVMALRWWPAAKPAVAHS